MYGVIPHVRIAGIAAAVPKTKQAILESHYGTLSDREKFIEMTGIEYRRVASVDQCTSDLAFEAASTLLNDLQWDKNDIGILLFVTQTPDYFMPSTAIVLQDRLGLTKNCIAFDINLGCSGYVVGLQVISNLLSTFKGKKALLLVGDTFARKCPAIHTLTFPPLFGDCGTATALEWCESAESIHIETGSDGAGYKHIIHENGMYRNPFNAQTSHINEQGELMNDNACTLDGHAIFNFSTRVVPVAIKSLLEKSQVAMDSIDYFVFHQANKLLNECIRRSLKIDPDKHPYSLHKFGNTSSATVPLTIVSELRQKLEKDVSYTVLASGFGIGLSWSSAILNLKNVHIPEILEM